MLCKIKNCHKIGFGIFLSVFAVALSVFFSLDTSAVADKSVTYNAGSTITNWQDIFSDCNTDSCLSQYSYLSISIDSFNHSLNPDLRVSVDPSWSGTFNYRSFSSFYIIYLPWSGSNVYLRFSNSPSDTFSNNVTFTLMESYAVLPSGNLDISQNGEYNVSSYATVNVNVPPTVVQGDYHDDLVKINNSILVCGAICLVLYFFYCIYRLIIRNSGSS